MYNSRHLSSTEPTDQRRTPSRKRAIPLPHLSFPSIAQKPERHASKCWTTLTQCWQTKTYIYRARSFLQGGVMGRGSAVAAVVLLRWPSVDVDVDHFFESAFINEKPYANKTYSALYSHLPHHRPFQATPWQSSETTLSRYGRLLHSS